MGPGKKNAKVHIRALEGVIKAQAAATSIAEGQYSPDISSGNATKAAQPLDIQYMTVNMAVDPITQLTPSMYITKNIVPTSPTEADPSAEFPTPFYNFTSMSENITISKYNTQSSEYYSNSESSPTPSPIPTPISPIPTPITPTPTPIIPNTKHQYQHQ